MNVRLVRLDDWEPRLIKFLGQRRRTPYSWGVNDCATFCRDFVEVITGVNVLADLRWPRGPMGAAKFVLSRGWENMEDAATSVLGAPMEDPAMARVGDIVSFLRDDDIHIGVRVGDLALSPGGAGLEIAVPPWRKAWPIGWSVGPTQRVSELGPR